MRCTLVTLQRRIDRALGVSFGLISLSKNFVSIRLFANQPKVAYLPCTRSVVSRCRCCGLGEGSLHCQRPRMLVPLAKVNDVEWVEYILLSCDANTRNSLPTQMRTSSCRNRPVRRCLQRSNPTPPATCQSSDQHLCRVSIRCVRSCMKF